MAHPVGMWIFLRDSFLSVVQHGDEPKLMQIRARIRGDIEHVFPEADVAEDEFSDYRFCAVLSRERVAHAIALRIGQVHYTSLNEEVCDTDRARAYDQCYAAMLEEQVNRYGAELEPLPAFVPVIDLEG